MTIEKTARLAVKLLEKTKAGALEWIPTQRDDAFEVAFPDASVLVAREDGGSALTTGPEYFLSLLDSEGRVIHTANDLDLQAHLGEEAFPVMRELHEAARSTALGVERKLDRILALLDSQT